MTDVDEQSIILRGGGETTGVDEGAGAEAEEEAGAPRCINSSGLKRVGGRVISGVDMGCQSLKLESSVDMGRQNPCRNNCNIFRKSRSLSLENILPTRPLK